MSLHTHPALLRASLLLTLILTCSASRAQGCAQCQDSTASTPARTQAAYRRAIILMTVSAGSIFIGGVFLLRRHR